MPMGERNRQGGSRRWLFTALDDSLRRLGVDHVDLYQMHRWDPTTSDEETLSALTDLQRAGKIRYFGSSTFPAYRIVQAQWAAREHRLSRYVTEQPSYSILERGIESHVLPVTEEYGMGVLAWSPLASGWLSGAVRKGRDVATHRSAVLPERFDPSQPYNQARYDAVERLSEVADEAGLTLIQLALGFVTTHPAVTAALIGPARPSTSGRSSPPRTPCSPPTSSTRSTRSSPPAPTWPPAKFDTPPALLDASLRRRRH